MALNAFIFGFLAACIALATELVTLGGRGTFSYSSPLINFSSISILLCVALIEEGARFLLAFQFQKRFLDQASWRQIFPDAFFFGIGFASLELTLLLFRNTIPLVPILGILFIHTLLSLLALLGWHVRFRFSPLVTFLFACLLHLGYNLIQAHLI